MKHNFKFAIFLSLYFLCSATPLLAEEEHSHKHRDHGQHEGHNHGAEDDSHDSHGHGKNQEGSHDDHQDGDDGHKHEGEEDNSHDSHGHGKESHDDHSGGQDETSSNNGAHSDHDHEEHRENFVSISLEKAKRAGVQIATVGEVELHDTLELYGETALDPDRIVHVVPRFPGVIIQVGKHLGEHVKKGELLAKIQSNESLSSYDIKSQIDGVIIRKDAARGEFVNNESEIFVIASLDNIWVNVAIFPRDLGRIRLGTPALVVSDAAELSQLGKFNYIRPTLTEATRTALARIELDNTTSKWFPGMFVEVEARLESKRTPIGVPNTSLLLLENKMGVFVFSKSENGKAGFEVRHVEVGESDGKSSEILHGLKSGEQVASGRTFILKAELGKGEASHEH